MDGVVKRSKFIILSALFATGFSGLVSEYILATLASYILGNSILQWSLILSFMLFFMGVGSRVSRYVNGNLIRKFINIELVLSVLISFSTLIVYGALPWIRSIDVLIYLLAMGIGFLIGMEIPIVTRINSNNEELKFNISSVMEWDYFGSLLGGLFFGFIAIQYIGIVYTPFIIGGVNLLVATFVQVFLDRQEFKRFLLVMLCIVLLILGVLSAKEVVVFGDQERYGGQIIYSHETKFQKITITKEHNDYTLFLNQGKQLNTLDEWMYHEPLVHPAMIVCPKPKNILIMGAGDGGAVREVLKHESVEQITLIDLDSMVTYLAKTHPVFLGMNERSLHDKKVSVFNIDAFNYVDTCTQKYDVIIADFPDPRNVDLAKLYSREFYSLCSNILSHRGVFVTQASSPYYTTVANYCIQKTMQSAGFYTVPLQHHVYSFGEWGWVMGSKFFENKELSQRMEAYNTTIPRTRFFNSSKFPGTLLAQKPSLILVDSAKVEVSTLYNPLIYRYYLEGDWTYN